MHTVLIVDDNEVVRQGLSSVLRARGLQPVQASDLNEAIMSLGLARPDLIVLDNRLPDFDGITLLEHIRSRPRLAEVPVVLFSGYVTDTVRQRAADLGVVDTIDKGSVDWAAVADRVQEHLAVRPAENGSGSVAGA